MKLKTLVTNFLFKTYWRRKISEVPAEWQKIICEILYGSHSNFFCTACESYDCCHCHTFRYWYYSEFRDICLYFPRIMSGYTVTACKICREHGRVEINPVRVAEFMDAILSR